MTSSNTAERQLSLVLLIRAAVNAALALWVLLRRPEWSTLFEASVSYALVDGIVALGLAVLITQAPAVRMPSLVAGITAADGLARIAGGVALLALPGVYEFPVTVAMLFGAAGVVMSVLGTLAFVAWLGARSRRDPESPYTLLDSLAFAAFVSLVLGFFLIVRPPVTERAIRAVAAGCGAALAVSFALASAALARAGATAAPGATSAPFRATRPS